MAKKTTAPTTTQPSQTTTDEPQLLLASTELTLILPIDQVKSMYDQVLSQMAKRVKSPGFRPGKVPPVVAKDIIGEDSLKQATAERLMPAAYSELIKGANKQPLTQPEIQAKKLDMDADWEFTVLIAERPTLTVKNHEKIVKQAKKTAEKDIAAADKAVKEGKQPPVEPGHEGHDHAKQDTPLTEEQKKDRTLQFIFRDLITEYKPQVPELLLKQDTRAEIDEMVRSLEQLKMKLDDYLARRQITFEQLTNEVATQTLGKLQLDLLYSALIDDQKMTVTDADIEKFLERIKDEKARHQQRQDERYMAYIRTLILREKVSEYLLSL